MGERKAEVRGPQPQRRHSQRGPAQAQAAVMAEKVQKR